MPSALHIRILSSEDLRPGLFLLWRLAVHIQFDGNPPELVEVLGTDEDGSVALGAVRTRILVQTSPDELAADALVVFVALEVTCLIKS